tara:strand:+ start:7659 stop:8351 length:693 start_codon:yes stop_codon:yes gene_type:complete
MLPTIIEINPTELCNRRCSFCPRSSTYPNQNLNLSIDDAFIIKERLNEIDFNGRLHFTGQGEPTLNKKLFQIAKIFDYEKRIVTNGDFLTNEIFDVFDVVTISVYDKNDWHKYSKWKKAKLRKQWIPETIMNNCGGFFDDEPVQGPCHYPFYKAYIDWNLDIRLCCHDWKDKIVMGNLREERFDSIWYGKKYNEYRINQRSKSPCINCNVIGTLEGKQWSIQNFNHSKNV